MSADLTPPEYEHSEAVGVAARWLATTPLHERPRPIIPAMQKRFGLSAKDACLAIREATLISARAI